MHGLSFWASVDECPSVMEFLDDHFHELYEEFATKEKFAVTYVGDTEAADYLNLAAIPSIHLVECPGEVVHSNEAPEGVKPCGKHVQTIDTSCAQVTATRCALWLREHSDC